MKLSIKDLQKAISELPSDPSISEERRIGKRISFYNDDGVKVETLIIDVFFSKSNNKKEWLLEWPTVPKKEELRAH